MATALSAKPTLDGLLVHSVKTPLSNLCAITSCHKPTGMSGLLLNPRWKPPARMIGIPENTYFILETAWRFLSGLCLIFPATGNPTNHKSK